MKTKYIVNIISILAIISILVCIIIEIKEDNNVKEKVYESQKLTEYMNIIQNTENAIIEEEVEEQKIYPKEEVITTYKGYDVCAKLEIPSISLETNILNEYSKNALWVSVTKFWGVEPNKIGNFCVAGHNSKKQNMFYNLKKLKLGDRLFVIDNSIGKVEYEIFNIDKVLPEDVSCLDSVTNNEREVTLITCTNDSKQRVIIKAKEVANTD